MWICAFHFLRSRFLGVLLLSLLLLLTFPVAVRVAAVTEAPAPDCARTGLSPQPVAVQLTRTGELVQATLHAAPGDLPASGCRASLQFQIPEDARPPYVVWRDVEGRAVQPDGTLDPARPDALPLRLWIRPDGNLEYEAREAGVPATHAALNLAVAWGTTAVANDLAVLDILGTALELELSPQELGAWLDDSGRVTELDWNDVHPYETYDDWTGGVFARIPMSGIHPPGVRVAWQLPSELGQLTAMYRLALGGPLLTGTIPPELGQLANLEQLTLAGSRLTGSVPPELAQLTQLWKLELHDNQLTVLPPELGRLTQLVNLGLAGNQLTVLPPELGRLTKLKLLDVQDNQLTSLPPLTGLKQLIYLDASGNRLTTLPPSLKQLSFLTHLDLSDNQLTALSSKWLQPGWQTVFQAKNSDDGFVRLLQLILQGTARLRSPGSPLTKLDLSGNQLTGLPPELGRLRLDLLDLSDNQLTELPPQLGRLQPPARFNFIHGAQPILTLDLSGNQLTDLPPELGWISHRVHLDLSNNRLTNLPKALFRLDRLTRLNLSSNQLGTLPPEIGVLATLETLGLSDNQFTVLPPELGQLSQLISLDLSDNRLTDLPPELGQLSQLVSLDLSGNQLTGLSDPAVASEQAARWPRRLTRLDLSGNQLAEIPPVLRRLKVLNLSHNQLTNPSLDRDQLKNLTHLDLSHNQLADLPLELDQLKNLTHLDLGHNRFSAIPPVLSQLRPLLSLNLRGNSLTTCPLPLPWQIDRYIYPPDYEYFGNFDHRLLSPMSGTEPSDLPFLDLCPE
ncbi:MAG: leucine-rich repeat domain-containing protein [Caldilineaceae bacterium]|nr:leucine-rich repeat domain-containing protein [Caldilineaceae bacterium]